MFDKIKRFYALRLYNKQQVHKFVEKGVITEEQYDEITAENTPLPKEG